MSAAAPAFDAAALAAGSRLFSGPIEFRLGVTGLDALPTDGRPEMAFAGRSNVGKSSLLNAVTKRKALARTSGDPGRTRELNFFDLGGLAYLVDLPGYGYARAPKSEIKRWTALTRDYLRGRLELKRVFVLIDSRHGLKSNDESVMDALDEAAVSYQIVLTKADKLKPGAAERAREAAADAIRRRAAAHPIVHLTSSSKADGLEALRAEIAALAGA